LLPTKSSSAAQATATTIRRRESSKGNSGTSSACRGNCYERVTSSGRISAN
jgi:hypothetical protein